MFAFHPPVEQMPLKVTCTLLTSTSIRGSKTDVSVLLDPVFYVPSVDGSSYRENRSKYMERGNGANEPSPPVLPRSNRPLSRMLENSWTLGLTRPPSDVSRRSAVGA